MDARWAIATLLFLPLPATAQHLYVDPEGKVFFDVNCSPGRRFIMNQTTPTKSTKTETELRTLLKQISGNPVLLRQALTHPVPEYRFTGIYAVAIKKLEMQDDLIAMLTDAHPTVRLAARQALVLATTRYGKREDFGPLPHASAGQIRESQAAWGVWFEQRREHLKEKKLK